MRVNAFFFASRRDGRPAAVPQILLFFLFTPAADLDRIPGEPDRLRPDRPQRLRD